MDIFTPFRILCMFSVLCIQSTYGQDFYFSINGDRSENNSLIRMENIGEGLTALYCVTSVRPCCRTNFQGDWFYPDGTKMSIRASTDNFYRNRDNSGGVILNRRNNAMGPNGQYKCVIPGPTMAETVTLVARIYSELAFPTILSQPLSLNNVAPGTTVTFSVRSRDALRYRWVFKHRISDNESFIHEGARHRGVFTNTLQIRDLEESDEGFYYCLLEKELSLASTTAVLTVMDPPVIIEQPMSLPHYLKGDDATFTISAPAMALNYQWQFANGTDLLEGLKYTGVTTNHLTIHGVMSTASYRCAVSNAAGVVYSSLVNVTILEPPLIEVQPEDQLNIEPGQDVTLTLLATGHSISYQWQLGNGSDLNEGGVFEGVTTPTLMIREINEENAGSYQCRVSNPAGAVVSITVNVTFTPVAAVRSLIAEPFISSVQLSWNFTSLTPNTMFKVLYHHLAFPEAQITVEIENPSFLAVGLLPRSRYWFQVQQITPQGISSPVGIIVRLSKDIPPVEGLTVNITNSVLNISWQPSSAPLPGRDISYYQIHFSGLKTFTARTHNGNQFSYSVPRPNLTATDEEVELVIEVNGVIDSGLDGVGAIEGESTVLRTTMKPRETAFQIVLSPMDFCMSWSNEKTAEIRTEIQMALSEAVNSLNSNYFASRLSISPGTFSCRQSSNTVTYRSNLIGFNSEEIVSKIEQWVHAGNSTITLRSFVVDVQNNEDCPVRISSLMDPECILNDQGSTPKTLITNNPTVINCLSRCMADTEALSNCNSNP